LKVKLITYFGFLSFIGGIGISVGQELCSCEAFVDKTNIEIPILNQDKEKLYSLKTDEEKMDFYLFHILKDSSDLFFVQPYNWYQESKYPKGWISKADYIQGHYYYSKNHKKIV
jgi:hypothetical protein